MLTTVPSTCVQSLIIKVRANAIGGGDTRNRLVAAAVTTLFISLLSDSERADAEKNYDRLVERLSRVPIAHTVSNQPHCELANVPHCCGLRGTVNRRHPTAALGNEQTESDTPEIVLFQLDEPVKYGFALFMRNAFAQHTSSSSTWWRRTTIDP
jgi:hypothetical protein